MSKRGSSNIQCRNNGGFLAFSSVRREHVKSFSKSIRKSVSRKNQCRGEEGCSICAVHFEAAPFFSEVNNFMELQLQNETWEGRCPDTAKAWLYIITYICIQRCSLKHANIPVYIHSNTIFTFIHSNRREMSTHIAYSTDINTNISHIRTRTKLCIIIVLSNNIWARSFQILVTTCRVREPIFSVCQAENAKTLPLLPTSSWTSTR